jgi:hypothetical protein
MNLVDLLLQLSIPVWLALLLAVAAVIAMIYYRHLLERRIKQLEYRLQEKATAQEKAMELLQERQRKRLESLHRIGFHATIVVAPAVEGRLAYAESPGNLGDRGPCGQLGLRLAQLADDLLWRVPLFHREPFSFCPSGAAGRTLIVTGSVFGEQVPRPFSEGTPQTVGATLRWLAPLL